MGVKIDVGPHLHKYPLTFPQLPQLIFLHVFTRVFFLIFLVCLFLNLLAIVAGSCR